MSQPQEFNNLDDMFYVAVSDVLNYGRISDPRGMGTTEVVNWTATLLNPRARRLANYSRNIRRGYPAASVAWNLGMRDDVESICWWNENGRRISDDGITFAGANYGQRWDGYLEEALHLLRQDPSTRRAWVPIWAPTDLVDRQLEIQYSREGKDVPCTLGFGLRLHSGELDMQVVMRSQSAIGVMPYDVYLFSVLQELIANTLEVGLGRLHWTCNSLHIYQRETDWARAIRRAERPVAQVMEPIELTYEEAKEEWPKYEYALRTGANLETGHHDPIVTEMIEGAADLKRIQAKTA